MAWRASVLRAAERVMLSGDTPFRLSDRAPQARERTTLSRGSVAQAHGGPASPRDAAAISGVGDTRAMRRRLQREGWRRGDGREEERRRSQGLRDTARRTTDAGHTHLLTAARCPAPGARCPTPDARFPHGQPVFQAAIKPTTSRMFTALSPLLSLPGPPAFQLIMKSTTSRMFAAPSALKSAEQAVPT